MNCQLYDIAEFSFTVHSLKIKTELMENQLTVMELIKQLEKQPQDSLVVFYEKDSVYETKVSRVYVSGYDKKHGLKQVTLS